MTLRKQVFLGFGGTALLVLAVTVTVLLLNRRVSYALEKVVTSNRTEQQVVERMLVEVKFVSRAEHISADDPLARELILGFLKDLRTQANRLFKATGAGLELALEMEESASEAEEETELTTITQLLAAVSAVETELEGLAPGASDEGVFAKALNERIAPLVHALHADAMAEFSHEFAELEKMTSSTFNAVRFVAMGAGILIVITAIHMALGFSKPFHSLGRATREISRGNFDFQIEYERPNEMGDLARSFNQMSEKLRGTTLSRDLVETIIDSMGSGIVVLDPQRVITRVNRGFRDLLGYTELELRGKSLDLYIVETEENADSCDSQFTYEICEAQIRHSAGGVIPVNLIESEISRGSGARGSVVVLQDLRPFKESQQALIEGKREAELANAMKSQFLANMSHEIRTPMNGVVGMTEMLLDTKMDEEQQSYLRTIQTASNHLLEIINEVLDFAKMEAGQVQLIPENVHLSSLLESIVSLFAVPARDQNIRLGLDLAQDLPRAAFLDAARLRQVLVNLISNAIKFTPGGQVIVRVKTVDRGDGRGSLRFEVSDTGIGIPMEHRQGIFKPFQQVDGSLSREVQGTGLGLGICASLVELMGSEIQLESEVEVGSTFFFDLDIPSEMLDGVATESSIEPGVHRQAVILEPVAAVRTIVERYLGESGYACHVADPAHPGPAQTERLKSADLVWLGFDPKGPSKTPFRQILKDTSKTARIVVMVGSNQDEEGENARIASEDSRVNYFKGPILPSVMKNRFSCLEKAAIAPVTDLTKPRLSAEKLQVLLVDDDAINCRVGSLVLKKRGHEVRTARSAQLAFEMLVSGSFDVILMDIQMPKMDGFEATAEIRRRERESGRGPSLIIACTAHAIKGYDELCRDQGMDGYITKPIKADSFSAQIERIFQRKPEIVNMA